MRRRDLRDGAIAAPITQRAAVGLLAACLAGAAWTPAHAAELTAAEERGKYIYTEGKSRSRRVITASIRRGAAPAPAAILPCTSCHGSDGHGADEYSGVASLNINWYALASAGTHEHSKRSHAAFDEDSVARAITEGMDPDGNSLDSTMPRYNMDGEDVSDLIAYLKVIDSQSDPGISSASIRLGTVLPMAGQLAGLGRAMRDTIEACFSTVNAAGGVHGRKLELVVGSWGANDGPPIWEARNLVDNEPLFALVSSYVPDYDAEFEDLATEKKIPLIGPYTALPPGRTRDDTDDGGNRFTFYALAGLAQQVEVLVEATAVDHHASDIRLAVVYPQVQSFGELADAASRRADMLGFDSVLVSSYSYKQFDSEATVSKLRSARVDAIVFLGSAAELVQLGRAAERVAWYPYLLSPGLLAEREVFDLPKSFSGRVLLAYASLPSDYSPEGAAEFEKLHEEFRFDYKYSIAQIAAYTAAKIAVEGLERAGRRLNREQLVTALEGLNGFHAGLVPPISYGPERRLGTLGGHIVRADLVASKFDETTVWIGLDD